MLCGNERIHNFSLNDGISVFIETGGEKVVVIGCGQPHPCVDGSGLCQSAS